MSNPLTDRDIERLIAAQLGAKHTRVPLKLYTAYQPRTVPRFNKYKKEEISKYLKNPATYEEELRDVSNYMYANSTHYYNLINFYALMPTWAHTITPIRFNGKTAKPEEIHKQYLKVSQRVAKMNIKHEFIKVMRTCFREDVFYGICLETKEAFQIQQLDPSMCQISSIVDGVFNFAIDLGMIVEEELGFYPDYVVEAWQDFMTKYNGFSFNSRYRWFEIPTEHSICIKLNEDLPYPLPPFAAAMELLYDIDDYGDLIKERAKIDIYKLLHLRVPMDGELNTMDHDIAEQYYDQTDTVLPENIGLIMTPMEVSEVDFEKSGLADTNEVARAEERFWNASGTSPLLFGGTAASSVAALQLSIKGNEQIVLALMRQIERWLNRRLLQTPGKIKFKANILPITHFNEKEKIAAYKDAAALGQPVKSAYGALVDLDPNDISAMAFLENDVLDLPETMVPLNSTYTQSGSEQGGRPTNESQGEDLSPQGEVTQRNDSNAKRGAS